MILISSIFPHRRKKDKYELSMIISKQDKEAGSGLAFIGLYGENQRLIQTFSTSVSATDTTSQKMTVTTNISSGETVLEARAYVWDSYNGMQPIAEPGTVTKIPQAPTEPTDPSDPSDIPTDLPHLAFLSEIGIMSARHEEQNLTRGEAAEIAVKILKHQRFAAALEDSTDFADIDAGTTLCGYVQYCVQNGYLAAEGDTFRPDSAITYGDLIKMLVDLLGYKEYAEARGYTSDLYTVSLDQLEDQESYTAYAYGEKNADGTYPYVILTAATGTLAIEPDDPEEDPTKIEARYAVAEKLTKSSMDDFYKISLFCDDGTERLLEVDPYRCSWNGIFGNAMIDGILGFIYSDGNSIKRDLANRIVKYKLSPTTGKLLSLEAAEISMDLNRAAFDEATQTLRETRYDYINGEEIKTFREIKLGKQTKILNGIDYSDSWGYGGHPTVSDLSIVTTDKLVDQLEYNVTAYGEPDSDGANPYVILTGKEQYPSWTQIAVLTAAPSETADGAYSIKALYGHEEQTFVTSDDIRGINIDNIDSLEKGDIVVLSFNQNGNVSELSRIVEASQIGLDRDYFSVRQNAERSQTLLSITIPPNSNWTKEWSDRFDTEENMVHLVYGPIVDKTANSFTLGTYHEGKTYLYSPITDSIQSDSGRGGTMEFSLADETRVYVYDYSKSSKNRLNVGTKADIMSSKIDPYAISDDTIHWSNVTSYTINYAFAKVVNGEATDVFVILSE